MGGAPVPKAERSRRNRRLRVLSQKKQHAFYAAHLGETRPVLWEEAVQEDQRFGFTDNYIRVQRPAGEAIAGTIEPVRLGTFAEDGTVQAEDDAFIPVL